MYVKTTRVTRRGKVYQYGQLVEAYRREDGVPTQRVLANLGRRTDLEIANIRAALKASRDGRAVVLAEVNEAPSSVEVLDNLAWADVAVVIEVLRSLGVDRILEEVLPQQDAAWSGARSASPCSATRRGIRYAGRSSKVVATTAVR